MQIHSLRRTKNDLHHRRDHRCNRHTIDFRTPKPIGMDIFAAAPQLKYSKTLRSQLCIKRQWFKRGCHFICRGIRHPSDLLYGSAWGTVDVPAQSPAEHGKNGIAYPAYGSACLETQHFPNATSHPNFPSVILKAGDTFKSKTLFHFSVTSSKR